MIEQLARQLVDDINRVFGSEKPEPSKLKPLFESTLRKLNLVSREEFDAQQAVLQRTREKLEALEKKLADLECE